MKWNLVRLVNGTLVNPDGTVRSLEPSVPPPWQHGGSFGPYKWDTRPPGTAGGYEQCAVNGATAAYNPTGFEVVVFGFQGTVPHSAGFSAITEEPVKL